MVLQRKSQCLLYSHPCPMTLSVLHLSQLVDSDTITRMLGTPAGAHTSRGDLHRPSVAGLALVVLEPKSPYDIN